MYRKQAVRSGGHGLLSQKGPPRGDEQAVDMVNGGAVTALTRGVTAITYNSEIAARAALLAHWTRLGTLEAGSRHNRLPL